MRRPGTEAAPSDPEAREALYSVRALNLRRGRVREHAEGGAACNQGGSSPAVPVTSPPMNRIVLVLALIAHVEALKPSGPLPSLVRRRAQPDPHPELDAKLKPPHAPPLEHSVLLMVARQAGHPHIAALDLRTTGSLKNRSGDFGAASHEVVSLSLKRPGKPNPS